MRGWWATAGRYIHQWSAFVLSITRRQWYGRAHRREDKARSKAWQEFWTDKSRGGTFNAIFEQELDAGNSNSSSAAVRLASPPRSSSPRDRHLDRETGSPLHRKSKQQQQQQQQQHQWWKVWKRVPSEVNLKSFSRGSLLFANSPAAALTLAVSRRGLLEDTRLGVEVGIAKVFAWLRNITRAAFFLEKTPPPSPYIGSSGSSGGSLRGHHSQHHHRRGRKEKGQRWQDLHVFSASDAILRAGYPLEEHSVTTADGYVLQMHRIPQRNARDVVFLQHGVLDTSLGWVVGGTGNSVALAAHDAGFDVWLVRCCFSLI